MSEYEARQALQSIFDRYEIKQDVRRGLLGNSSGVVMVPDRSGWAYIRYREDLSRLSHVRYLLQEQLPDGCPVVVGKKHPADPFEQVLDVDWVMYAWSPAGGTVQQWATQAITLNDLAPGKVVPTNPHSLSVDVRGFLYADGDTAIEFGSGTIDLTGSVPGVAGHRLTLVYLDIDTDALASTDGAIVAVGTDAVAPDVPENSIPLAVVDLANGDTTIPAGSIYQYKILYGTIGGEIPLDWLGDYTRGYIIRGGAADWEAYDASGDGYALYGDGTDILSSQTPHWKGGTHTWTPGDDQAIILNMDAAQTANIFQINDSGGDATSGFDERGIVFSDGDSDPSNFFGGNDAGNVATTGTDITAVGDHAGSKLTTGGYNTAYGSYSQAENLTGIENASFGDFALTGTAIGGSDFNYMVAVGSTVFYNARTGAEYDTAVGYYSGYSLITAKRVIYLGAYAGYRQTTVDDVLLVDNRQRANAATELTNAILYGTMAAAPEDQQLTINAGLHLDATRITVADHPYTIDLGDVNLFCDTDGGAITVNLPAGVLGRFVRIINCGSSANDVTITPNGAETVRGAATQTVSDSEIMILCFETTEHWW